jgi:hypothetical protein
VFYCIFFSWILFWLIDLCYFLMFLVPPVRIQGNWVECCFMGFCLVTFVTTGCLLWFHKCLWFVNWFYWWVIVLGLMSHWFVQVFNSLGFGLSIGFIDGSLFLVWWHTDLFKFSIRWALAFIWLDFVQFSLLIFDYQVIWCFILYLPKRFFWFCNTINRSRPNRNWLVWNFFRFYLVWFWI